MTCTNTLAGVHSTKSSLCSFITRVGSKSIRTVEWASYYCAQFELLIFLRGFHYSSFAWCTAQNNPRLSAVASWCSSFTSASSFSSSVWQSCNRWQKVRKSIMGKRWSDSDWFLSMLIQRMIMKNIHQSTWTDWTIRKHFIVKRPANAFFGCFSMTARVIWCYNLSLTFCTNLLYLLRLIFYNTFKTLLNCALTYCTK